MKSSLLVGKFVYSKCCPNECAEIVEVDWPYLGFRCCACGGYYSDFFSVKRDKEGLLSDIEELNRDFAFKLKMELI